MNNLPADYEERVYAGILGKIIGVYLGRPFEGWNNRKIEEELGEIHYYVHEKRGVPLIVADDDISGTFTFLRALSDHGVGIGLTSEMIGKTWLNYLVEKRTVLWWGGLGVSTEHTAYLRLKHGIPAPQSGSMALNGPVVAEQIGSQIFIDGWAMVCPGDPEQAFYLAGEAARVSHDGEAVYGAQIIAALEAQAFVESDLDRLLTTATSFIPRGSLIYELIQDLRTWKEQEPRDWRATFRKVEDKWGYDKYGGGCHMIPNHAIIILALLYGEDDFQRSLMIANTCGWDTDCNSANVGCILGIKNGLASIGRTVDFRGPVADRMYLPSADGGRCLTDAVRETYAVVNIARDLRDMPPLRPKNGMRYHFSLSGSVQGFIAEDTAEVRGCVQVTNISAQDLGPDAVEDERLLAIAYTGVGHGRSARVSTATFLPSEAMKEGGYGLAASPTLYSGQIVRARVLADPKNGHSAQVCLYIRVYGKDDALEILRGNTVSFGPGESHNFHWEIPDTGGRPIAEVGVEVSGHSGTGSVYLDWMSWENIPKVTLGRPDSGKSAWHHAWMNAVDDFRAWGASANRVYALVQNEGDGLITQGEAEWANYTVRTDGHAHLASAFGLLACGRGLRRYVALLLDRDSEGEGVARLVERYDEVVTTLDEIPYLWELGQEQPFSLTTKSNGSVVGYIGTGESPVRLEGQIVPTRAHGAVGLLVREGHCQFGAVRVEPAE